MLKSLGGGAFFGEVWGPGDPEVLALHGWGRTHGDFAGVVGPASPGGPLATLAPDLPGFGATPAPPGAWGAADYAAALVPLLTDLGDGGGGRPMVVLGHSRGGCIAVTLAALRPDLVRALVITGAPLVPRPGPRLKPAAPYRMARRLHRWGLVSEGRMEKARQRHGSTDYRAASGIMREVFVRMVNENYSDRLAELRCPVEFVWGDDDAEVPVAVARAAASIVTGSLAPRAAAPTNGADSVGAPSSETGATVTLCPGAGHLTPLTAPGELRAAVERALAGR